jgi:hypothetical protein
MNDAEADMLLKEVTDLLIQNRCIVNKPAMVELTIYIIEREKKVLTSIMDTIVPIAGGEL